MGNRGARCGGNFKRVPRQRKLIPGKTADTNGRTTSAALAGAGESTLKVEVSLPWGGLDVAGILFQSVAELLQVLGLDFSSVLEMQ